MDNTTLGVRPSTYTPANKSDYLPYHSERNLLNHEEYNRLKDAEMEKEEWKLEFDLNEEKVNEAIAQARANPSDPQKVEEEVEDEELLAMLNLDLNYQKGNLEFREQIREMRGTPGPAPGFEFDKPTLDMTRDLEFEQA
jgi:hypothetical protein